MLISRKSNPDKTSTPFSPHLSGNRQAFKPRDVVLRLIVSSSSSSAAIFHTKMPTYRSITLSLISQFDILTIPEYAPPESTSTELPTLVDPHQSLVSVYVPTYPSSQFWLAYSIAPPHPPNALYYFKLFLDGSHVVSWGCGEEDRYKGKTMFGLYKSGKVFDGRRYLEQRVLCFASDGAPESPAEGSASLGPLMEVRVYRSKGRKRIMPEAEQYEGSPLSEHKENQPAKTNSAGIR